MVHLFHAARQHSHCGGMWGLGGKNLEDERVEILGGKPLGKRRSSYLTNRSYLIDLILVL